MRLKALSPYIFVPFCVWLHTGCVQHSAISEGSHDRNDVEFRIKEEALLKARMVEAKTLKVVRRIQSDLGGNGQFVYPSSLAVSDKGGIYISDNNAHVIRYWPPDSDSIITLPVQQGTGKLVWPTRIEIREGSLFVIDIDGLKVFETDGTFQRLLRTFYQVNHFTIDPRGTVYVNPSFTNPNAGNPLIVELDCNGKRTKGFGARLNLDKAGLADEAYVRATSEHVVVVFKHRPTIHIYDTDGQLIREFNVTHHAFTGLAPLSRDEKFVSPEPGKYRLPKYISGAWVIEQSLLVLLDLPQPEIVEFTLEGQEVRRYRANLSPPIKAYQDFAMQRAEESYRFWILYGDGESYMALAEFIPSDE